MDRFAINNRGVEYFRQGKLDQALVCFERAVQMDSECVDALYNRGLVHYRKGKYDRAILDCSQTLEIDSQYAKAHNVRALAYVATKRYQSAIFDFGKAIEIGRWTLGEKYKDLQWAMNHLARLQATCPEAQFRDDKKAVELATEACELTDFKNHSFVDTLAAAYAAGGDFESAIKWQIKALELVSETDTKLRGSYEERLDLYESGRPYHEAAHK